MLIFTTLSTALRAPARHPATLALFWAGHTIAAALATLPLLAMAIPRVAHSALADELLRQFDFTFLAETLRATHNAAVPGAVIAILTSTALAMLAAVFLSAGAVSVLTRPGTGFFQGAALLFWRFLRLFLYSLLLYASVAVLHFLASRAAQKLWGEGSLEAPLAQFSWAATTVTLIACAFVSFSIDLAKVRLAVSQSNKVLRICSSSFALALARWRVTAPIVLALLALLAAATALLLALPALPLAALFLVQQLYVFARLALRLTAWAAAAQLDAAFFPAPAATAPAVVIEDYVI